MEKFKITTNMRHLRGATFSYAKWKRKTVKTQFLLISYYLNIYRTIIILLGSVSLGDLFGHWRHLDWAVAVAIVQKGRHGLLFIIRHIFGAQETRLVRWRQQPRPHPVCDHYIVLFLRYSLQHHNHSTQNKWRWQLWKWWLPDDTFINTIGSIKIFKSVL